MLLVPAPCEHVVYILRPLIDPLTPGQAGLLAERGHLLDQLVDLRIQEMLPVAGVDIFNVIRGRAEIPILHRH